jgi:plasmid stabilization system protein ParE
MAEVYYTEPALLDLDAILDFIAQRSDMETATAFINALSKTFHLLAEMPQMGRARNDLQQGLRMFVYRRYVILYSELETGVLIERVAPPYRSVEGMFEG